LLTLYYSPATCSMASHIGHEEAGACSRRSRWRSPKGEQQTPEYLKINPSGKAPALRLDDGSVLAENTAILTYLTKRFPDKNLLAQGPDGRERTSGRAPCALPPNRARLIDLMSTFGVGIRKGLVCRPITTPPSIMSAPRRGASAFEARACRSRRSVRSRIDG
jgi:Glutathione S-transferase, N-terminal domain